MSLKGYVITNATMVGAIFATSLDPNLKALAVVLIAVISFIANLLWIGEKFREAIIKKLMHDVSDETVRLGYLRRQNSTIPPQGSRGNMVICPLSKTVCAPMFAPKETKLSDPTKGKEK